MTVLHFTGRRRDAYPELRDDHMEFCLRDAFALCRAAGLGASMRDADGQDADSGEARHDVLARTLNRVSALHREHLPRIAVGFNALMMAIDAEDDGDVDAMIRRSLQSPRADGTWTGDRDLIRHYVLADTRPAVELMMRDVLSDPDAVACLRDMTEEKRFNELRRESVEILSRLYTPPDGNTLHAAINATLVAAGLAPDEDKQAPVPERGKKPSLKLI